MIYTANIGKKDRARNDIPCFTEVLGAESDRMEAKRYKILSHKFVDDEWSIWVDANVFLRVPEDELIKMVQPFEVGVFHHRKRDCVYTEGLFCINKKLGEPSTILKQVNDYWKVEYPEHNGLGNCFLIIRKHTEDVKKLNELWWWHIQTYSVRDQISFPFVFQKKVKYLPIQEPDNKYFMRKRHLK